MALILQERCAGIYLYYIKYSTTLRGAQTFQYGKAEIRGLLTNVTHVLRYFRRMPNSAKNMAISGALRKCFLQGSAHKTKKTATRDIGLPSSAFYSVFAATRYLIRRPLFTPLCMMPFRLCPRWLRQASTARSLQWLRNGRQCFYPWRYTR